MLNSTMQEEGDETMEEVKVPVAAVKGNWLKADWSKGDCSGGWGTPVTPGTLMQSGPWGAVRWINPKVASDDTVSLQKSLKLMAMEVPTNTDEVEAASRVEAQFDQGAGGSKNHE
jgi:hypothetical protein